MSRKWFRVWEKILLGVLITFVAIACQNIRSVNKSPSPPREQSLEIWWDKGYSLAEDEALRNIISTWEEQSGNKVTLKLFSSDNLVQKAKQAVAENQAPDILFASEGDLELYPLLAREGKLAEVTNIIEPLTKEFDSRVLDAISIERNDTKHYYTLPIAQYTIHLHYWHDLLAQTQQKKSDIPQDWHDFWHFWQQTQDKYRSLNPDSSVYGVGLTLSDLSSDSYLFFEQLLEAYNVEILDRDGNLQIESPEVRQGIIHCLTWVQNLYRQGYIHPDSVNWLNPDNNLSFLNRELLLTQNSTLSIPRAVYRDRDIYRDKLHTIEFPDKPNGQPMEYITSIKQAVIVADSSQIEIARDFLNFLVQPENLTTYLKQSGSRFLPIMKSIWKNDYWQNTDDPHIQIASHIFREEITRLPYNIHNPIYSQVFLENIWGLALQQVSLGEDLVEDIADRTIEKIQEIFSLAASSTGGAF